MKMKLANTHKSKIHFSSQIIYYYVVCIKKSFLFSTRMMEIQNNMSEQSMQPPLSNVDKISIFNWIIVNVRKVLSLTKKLCLDVV